MVKRVEERKRCHSHGHAGSWPKSGRVWPRSGPNHRVRSGLQRSAMPAPEPSAVRPSVRRKSSAPSFPPIGAVPALPPPAQTATMTRDWDIASGGDPGTATMATTPGTANATGSPSLGGQGTSVEYLRDLVQKRIITLNYMRDVHEGCVKHSCDPFTHNSV
jgi:hypothetical protein